MFSNHEPIAFVGVGLCLTVLLQPLSSRSQDTAASLHGLKGPVQNLVIETRRTLRYQQRANELSFFDDQNGSLAKRMIRGPSTHEELDRYGNWTSETTKLTIVNPDQNNDAIEVVRRIITYY